MGGLAHYLEDEGVATTLVALIRRHAEIIRPPRALWVPFELGRPLGPPGEPAFQSRVVRAALALLERGDGPVVLEDFPDESPDETGNPRWRPALTDGASDLPGEIALVRPAWEAACARQGYSTVGISGLDIDAAGAWLAALVGDETAPPPRRGLSPAQLMRFAADDLKAFYLEAAAQGPGHPCADQLAVWFWDGTVAGRTLKALRARCLASEDRHLRTIGAGALVPMPWRQG